MYTPAAEDSLFETNCGVVLTGAWVIRRVIICVLRTEHLLGTQTKKSSDFSECTVEMAVLFTTPGGRAILSPGFIWQCILEWTVNTYLYINCEESFWMQPTPRRPPWAATNRCCSRISKDFMEPECSLLHSQEPSTGPVHTTAFYASKIYFNIIFLCICLSSGLVRNPVSILHSHACYIPSYHNLLGLKILIIFCEEYKLWSSQLCNFPTLLLLNLSPVQIFSSAPCSQTPSVYVPPLMSRNQVSYPYKNRDKIIDLCSLFFAILDTRQEVLNWTRGSTARIQFPLNFLRNQILIC
jgi:hypothetical protein